MGLLLLYYIAILLFHIVIVDHDCVNNGYKDRHF